MRLECGILYALAEHPRSHIFIAGLGLFGVTVIFRVVGPLFKTEFY
jgi:hypothetical protein